MFPSDIKQFTYKTDGTTNEHRIESSHYNEVRSEILLIESVLQRCLLYSDGKRILVVPVVSANIALSAIPVGPSSSGMWKVNADVTASSGSHLYNAARKVLDGTHSVFSVMGDLVITSPDRRSWYTVMVPVAYIYYSGSNSTILVRFQFFVTRPNGSNDTLGATPVGTLRACMLLREK